MRIPVQRLHPAAQLPRYIHGDDDAAVDLHCIAGATVPPGEGRSFDTGWAIELPPGTVGLIWGRSGLSFKHNLTTLGGMIDPGFRGEVKVYLYNAGKEPYTVADGERIAQLLVVSVDRLEFEEVGELSKSVRGSDALGSSGK